MKNSKSKLRKHTKESLKIQHCHTKELKLKEEEKRITPIHKLFMLCISSFEKRNNKFNSKRINRHVAHVH